MVGAVISYYSNGLFGLFRDSHPLYRIHSITNEDLISTKSGPVGGSYVIPRPVQALGAPANGADSCVGRYQWAHAAGGIDAESTIALTSLDGLGSQAVTVTGIRAAVDHRSPPAIGSFVTCAGRGELAPIRTVDLNLDQRPTAITVYDAAGHRVAPYFSVTLGQTETFLITAHTNGYDVRWHPILDLLVDGKAIEVPILNSGRDFETTGSQNAAPYRWQDGRWQRQSTAGSNGQQSHVAPPLTDVCSATDPTTVRALLGAGRHREQGGGTPIQTHGLAAPLAVSVCSFTSTHTSTSRAVTTIVNAAADARSARAEFEAQQGKFDATGTRLRPLRGIGLRAALGDGLALILDGRFVITLQTQPAQLLTPRIALRLGRYAVARER